MAARTGIEYVDATWNPMSGCTRISEGCRNCYIERTPPFRYFEDPGTGERSHDVGARTAVLLHRERLDLPLHWRKPRRIFVCSLGDLFHDEVPDEFIARVWDIMAACQRHTFLTLTKRPARMRALMRRWKEHGDEDPYAPAAFGSWLPLPNVFLGVTAEGQQRAEERIPFLLGTPAAKRFVSVEPMLGPVNLERYFAMRNEACRQGHRGPMGGGGCLGHSPVDWVIAGGETGPRARPMHPDWVRSLRDQCQQAGIPFWFKQNGEYLHRSNLSDDQAQSIDAAINLAGNPQRWFRVGKNRSGRELDGRTWEETP